MTKLRLKTLRYAGADQADHAASLKCSNDLVELEAQSKRLVEQMDRLQNQLADFSEDPISFQIASQQLAYFTSEWHDNLTPQFDDTFRLAQEQLNAAGPAAAATAATTLATSTPAANSAGARVRGALLKLKQSTEENEKLILAMATNLECTKTSIQTIFESLQVTKINLEASRGQARESIQLQRQSTRAKLTCGAICFLILLALIVSVLRLIKII